MIRMTERPLVLDVGCGGNKQGDAGCDIRRLEPVDVICDMNNLPFRITVLLKSTAVL